MAVQNLLGFYLEIPNESSENCERKRLIHTDVEWIAARWKATAEKANRLEMLSYATRASGFAICVLSENLPFTFMVGIALLVSSICLGRLFHDLTPIAAKEHENWKKLLPEKQKEHEHKKMIEFARDFYLSREKDELVTKFFEESTLFFRNIRHHENHLSFFNTLKEKYDIFIKILDESFEFIDIENREYRKRANEYEKEIMTVIERIISDDKMANEVKFPYTVMRGQVKQRIEHAKKLHLIRLKRIINKPADEYNNYLAEYITNFIKSIKTFSELKIPEMEDFKAPGLLLEDLPDDFSFPTVGKDGRSETLISEANNYEWDEKWDDSYQKCVQHVLLLANGEANERK